VASGPILIGYDGSPASERAVREAGELLGRRPALVVFVWDAGVAFQMAELPAASIGVPAAPIDIRGALELEKEMSERAQRMAAHGALLAREAGFDAEGLAVADEITVSETLVRVARERDAAAIVVGAHGHSGLTERLLGTTSHGVIRKAERPVIVVHSHEEG
jgi:nucleotide-binding universal stress UspA family protein